MNTKILQQIGYIHKLESFGLVDGPGVRFIVFMQGCTLRCQFCHNPDSWAGGKGEKWKAEDLYRKILRYKRYWGKEGGITVSGGEPLLQMGFVKELFSYAKRDNVNTAIDTAGHPFSDNPYWIKEFKELMDVTDLILLDLKEMDNEKHRILTGHGNQNILKMATWLSDHHKDMWIRHVLVPGLTDDVDGLQQMYAFIRTLKTVRRVEVLPYHSFGVPKWQNLGLHYTLGDIPVPTEAQIQQANEILHTADFQAGDLPQMH